MFGALGNIFKIPELKRRIIFTFLMLLVYRIGCHVPVPGIDLAELQEWFKTVGQGVVGMFSMFSGGALSNGSIFALGIMPYISASIILQLLTVVIPYLERLSKEGEAGRRKITQYTRYGTVVLSVFQGLMIAYSLEQSLGSEVRYKIVTNPGWDFRLMAMVSMTAGTAFIMWLGEQISERGVGNGISLIIFGGIVARVPAAIKMLYQKIVHEDFLLQSIAVLLVMGFVVGFIIFMERGQRKIPIQHAKRVVGRRIYGGSSTSLPLKVNTAGVIPPIFASSILLFPATIAQYFQDNAVVAAISDQLNPGNMLYSIIYIALIIFFCYFYTAVTFNPVDVADNLKKSGAYIPGIRPGKRTADYIDRILTRITLGGSIYVSAICVLPTILIQRFQVPFYFGGTALLIVVGVGLDTISQIESHMLTRHYDGFLGGKGKFKGRR
ncbi:MAG: preprotein translocase subunit SecY [Candidatus Alcyoniella australis]|nr:preprotein translocase subunit SecY [Candidatus Alcyoniella australis]